VALGKMRMRDDPVPQYPLLLANRHIALAPQADRLDMTKRNAHHQINSFSGCLPLRSDVGIVINTKQNEEGASIFLHIHLARAFRPHPDKTDKTLASFSIYIVNLAT
jgi:hypothetical protein